MNSHQLWLAVKVKINPNPFNDIDTIISRWLPTKFNANHYLPNIFDTWNDYYHRMKPVSVKSFQPPTAVIKVKPPLPADDPVAMIRWLIVS